MTPKERNEFGEWISAEEELRKVFTPYMATKLMKIMVKNLKHTDINEPPVETLISVDTLKDILNWIKVQYG